MLNKLWTHQHRINDKKEESDNDKEVVTKKNEEVTPVPKDEKKEVESANQSGDTSALDEDDTKEESKKINSGNTR